MHASDSVRTWQSSVADFVKILVAGKFRLHFDSEPSIMAVVEKVTPIMPDRVVVDNSPRHNSTSNGIAERAIRTNGKELRTLRYDTQNRCKTRITPDSAVWPWLVSHAVPDTV